MLTRSSFVLVVYVQSAMHFKRGCRGVSCFLIHVFVLIQLFLQDESDLEESADENDELKEINGGNVCRVYFI